MTPEILDIVVTSLFVEAFVAMIPVFLLLMAVNALKRL